MSTIRLDGRDASRRCAGSRRSGEEMTAGTPARITRLGFLYPGYAAEEDYARLAGRLGSDVVAEMVHTSVGEDAHRVDALLDLGGEQRLLDGAHALARKRPDAVMWACTSGSFVFGWSGAHDQVAALHETLGVPVSSTSFAFVHAARALRLRRVAVAATYPAEVADRFRDFLLEGGLDVVRSRGHDIESAAEAGGLGGEEVRRMALANDTPGAEGVLLPDTAMHTAAHLDELENVCGKPVLTANQVTMWMALGLAGRQEPHATLGRLFRCALPDTVPSP